MTATSVLRGFGLFVEESFLDADLCARVRTEMRSADQAPAETVYSSGREVDRDFRRSSLAEVSEATLGLIDDRLSSLQPKLAEHFGFQPEPLKELQFLRYTRGDFFRPHSDDSHQGRRRVSMIVFLNDQSEKPWDHCYGGGALVFYGLMDDPRAASIGFPVSGRAGLVVAFKSGILHEVEPITHGERYTIVRWFC